LICGAAKNSGICEQSNSNWLYFGLPRSQNFRNLTTRLHFVLPRSENFGICQQKQLKLTGFYSAAAKTFWNLPTQASQIDRSVLPRSENIWNLPNIFRKHTHLHGHFAKDCSFG
jgi:hypothetical protein